MHLLIDGKNLIYRGVYVSENSDTDSFTIISNMIYTYYNMFKATSVHVFWDDDRQNLWRTQIFSGYKESECRNKSNSISDKVKACQMVCEDIWSNMGVKQYKRNHMEADDLIFAFCHMICEDSVIVSNDGDLTQIPYRYRHVQLYNPIKKEIYSRGYDPIIMKCLDGDKSDNIAGYKGVGEKTSAKCAKNVRSFYDVVSSDNFKTYKNNRQLIDLSLCPHLCDNMEYILQSINAKVKFNKQAILESIYNKHKIRGIMSKFKSVIMPFAMIGDDNASTCCVCKTNEHS